jgi:Trypsin-like peptidase domain/Effector-associated domain 1
MGQVDGRQASQLSEGLREAFTPDALDEVLFYALDVRREDITLADNYRARVFQLIRQADAEGWVLELVVAAREARPRNATLQAVAADLGLSSAPRSLERLINDSVPFVDVSAWRAQLGLLEGQVCRVEIPAGLRGSVGTGFLVGPDLCLTNFHVVRPLIDGEADPADVRLRFDYRRASDGTTVNEGQCFSLAQDWLVMAQPPSAADGEPDSAGHLPAADELDFALLRVDGAPGETPAGQADKVRDAPARGWIQQIGRDGFDVDSPLFVLQHPEGDPLKLAFGPSAGLNANGTRLRHRVNTEPGSSGSPCLNARLELIGLHHAGDPNFDAGHKPAYNSAIPISAILACIGDRPVRSEIFS